MPAVTLVLHVHQPFRLRHNYFKGDMYDTGLNKIVLDRCSDKSYLRTNNILLEVMEHLKTFKMGFSLSGTFLEQCEKMRPDVLDSFKQVCETGQVEVLSETYYHSLASLYENKDEFKDQVKEHRQAITDLLSKKALGKVMRNTELIYDNTIGKLAEEMGFKGIFTEGVDFKLEWRSPNFLYKTPGCNTKILMRNYRLSDDIGYRFSSKWWEEWPLTAEKFTAWLSATPGDVVNLYMDFETFGEHHWENSNIFHFLKALPYFVDRNCNTHFMKPTEVVEKFSPVAEFDVPWAISWADLERDVSAWLKNDMQHKSFNKIMGLRDKILKTKNAELIKKWRCLQTSDHLYYMCDKWWNDGDIHKYFSYYDTPKRAYLNYSRAINRVEKEADDILKNKESS